MRSCLWTVLALLVLTGFPVGAVAQDKPTPETVEASKRFRRGVQLYREGAFRAALIEFNRAYALKPHYRLLYNMGQTQLELGDYLAATEALRTYLEEGGSEVAPARRAEVEKKLANLRERVAFIAITVNRDGAEVFVDDRNVGKSPIAKSVAVNLGRHRVSARGDDDATASQVVDVAGGDVAEVELNLEATDQEAELTGDGEGTDQADGTSTLTPVPESAARSRYRKTALGMLAATGALAAGTVVAAFLHRSEFQAYEDEVNRPGADPNEVASLNSNAWRRAVITDVMGGLTIVAAATSATFWWLSRRDKESSDKPQLQVGLAGAGLRLEGSF